MTDGHEPTVHQSDAVDRQTATLNLEVNVQRSIGKRGEANARLTTQSENESGVDRTAPPDGGCPSAPEEPESYVALSVRWARSWLSEVDEARKALDRAERISELRRAKAFSIRDPLGTEPHGKGGVSDPMRKVDEMIDGEAEDATYGWARDALALFDLMAALNKPLFRGQLLSGLDIAEMKYRLGATDAEVMRVFCIGKSKLHEDLGVLVDYLDYIGPEQAFHVDTADDEEPEALPPNEVATGPHGDAYSDIETMVMDRTT